MTKRRGLVLKSFAWTVVLTSLFVMTLGAVLIAYVVGDWMFLKTANAGLSWFFGSVVLVGFLATLGGGIGFWLWVKSPKTEAQSVPTDTMDIILADMAARD